MASAPKSRKATPIALHNGRKQTTTQPELVKDATYGKDATFVSDRGEFLLVLFLVRVNYQKGTIGSVFATCTSY
jgi:hypothetical protein